MKFDKLSIHAKQVIVDAFGELINSIEEDGQVTALYLVNDFYAEIRYTGNIAHQITKISDSYRLMLYCPELDL